MKKSVLIFVILFCINLLHANQIAFAENNCYAKIGSSGVMLYSSKNDNTNLFEIPASYFVKVISIENDYLKVSYSNIEGYVKKNQATLMNGTPQNPYANANFKVFVSNFIYSNANQTSSVVCPISTADNLIYYGTKQGQQISSTSNVWYYCSLEKDGQKYYGYVFCGITDYLSQIPTNTESFDILDESTISITTPYTEVASLSTKTKILLIVSISLPSALILYFLIKPSRIQITKSKRQIQKQRKIRHGDYYEFDENDL